MEVFVTGVNHRTAPVDVREQFSLPGDLAGALLRTIRTERVFQEAAVLDTCNRTEIYTVSGRAQDQFGHVLQHIAQLKGAAPAADESLFYRHRGMDAVAHLFRVIAGLDSMVLGENEIVGQVRAAYRLATESRTAGFVLNRIFHRAFRVGKRVRTETGLSAGSASVAQGAVELAGHVFSSLEGKAVLLVGAGQTAELAAQALIRAGAEALIVANRTVSRAEDLARRLLEEHLAELEAPTPACRPDGSSDGPVCPALKRLAPECSLEEQMPAAACRLTTRAIGLDGIASALGEVDLVISSTGASEPVLTYEELGTRLGLSDRTLLMIDIAVPRDIDERLGRLANVFLYNIDDLDRLVNQALDRRRLEVPRAQAIIDHEADQIRLWFDAQQVVPTIKGLQEMIAQCRDTELAKYGRKFAHGDREQIEKFAEGLCKRIFHRPFTHLRRLSADDSSSDVMAAVNLLRQLFELDVREAEAHE